TSEYERAKELAVKFIEKSADAGHPPEIRLKREKARDAVRTFFPVAERIIAQAPIESIRSYLFTEFPSTMRIKNLLNRLQSLNHPEFANLQKEYQEFLAKVLNAVTLEPREVIRALEAADSVYQPHTEYGD
ncbi:MAG: hypothetical protein KDD25_03270, partial [Bdellovibrionales bacterium]|nr:hypothetical protein [Bdellovibrionales bacterium]